VKGGGRGGRIPTAFRAGFPRPRLRGERGPLSGIDWLVRSIYARILHAGKPAIRRNGRCRARLTKKPLSRRARLRTPNDNSVRKVTSHVPANGSSERLSGDAPGACQVEDPPARKLLPKISLLVWRVRELPPFYFRLLFLFLFVYFSFAILVSRPIERAIAETLRYARRH